MTNGLKIALGGFAATVTIAIGVLVWSVIGVQKQVADIQRQILSTDTAPQELMGWAGKEAFEAQLPALEQMTPAFEIIGAPRDNAKKVVNLWDAERQLLGSTIPAMQQLVGDCVGAGAKQAVERLHCSQAITEGSNTYKEVFEAYHYACGRNAPECGNGRLNKGREPWSGSIGGWQALALKNYGVLAQDAEAEDGETLPKYSLAVIKSWAVKMPATKWVNVGRQYPVKTIARVKTADQIRDAICSGYPVTIASDCGFSMQPQIQNGKLVNFRNGVWKHQMCVLGYDGAGQGGPYWYILNSWGPKAHGTPVDNSPAGGFWVTKRDMDYIAAQDSWALSDAEGFPARDWQFVDGRWGWHGKNSDLAMAAWLQGDAVRLCLALAL
jgi:hypothetical protein